MAARTLPKNAPRRVCLFCVADEDNRALVEQFVATRKDLVLLQAPDLDFALSLARKQHPDVMFLDIDLPGVCMASLMKILRANPATQACPVVALAEDTLPETAVKALDAGFFQYLVKPLQTGLLTEALDYALEFAALERAEL